MEFNKHTGRILPSPDELHALGMPDMVGGIPLVGLPEVKARVSGFFAVNRLNQQESRRERDTERLFKLRGAEHILREAYRGLVRIEDESWGQVFEERPLGQVDFEILSD